MTSFKRYYLYRMRSGLIPFITITVISMIMVISTLAEEHNNQSSGLTVTTSLMGILATFMPILEYAQLKSKRSLDTLFSLPVSRRNIVLAHFLSGYTQIATIFTVSFIYLFINRVLTGDFIVGYFFLYYIITLVYGLLLYSIFSFVFNQARTIVDGIIITVLYAIAPLLISTGLEIIINEFDSSDKFISVWYNLYTPMNRITKVIRTACEPDKWIKDDSLKTDDIISLIIIVLLSVAAFIGLVYFFKNTKAEKEEGISDSPFAYKTLIPICGVVYTASGMFPLFILIPMIVGYIIYRRGFGFKKPDYICTAAVGILSIISYIIL